MTWISVKDRLPKLWENVLIYGPDVKVGEGYRGCNPTKLVETWWRSLSEHLKEDYSQIEEAGVTHWMPLPEPPKDQTLQKSQKLGKVS